LEEGLFVYFAEDGGVVWCLLLLSLGDAALEF
jgi:hypothetical protein